MFCPNCGHQVADGSRFCGNCGNPVSAPQAPVQQPVYQPPKKKKKGFNWLVLVIILLVAAIIGGIVFYGFSEGWFDGGSSKPSSASKSDKEEDTDEDDEDEDDNEEEEEEETKAAKREDVTSYSLPGLTFYIGNDWEAEEYSDSYYFTCNNSVIEAEMDDLDEAPVEINNSKEMAEWFMDWYAENYQNDKMELREKNGVPYVYIITDDIEIYIASFYVNDPYVYVLMAEVADESLEEDVLYFLTSGETSGVMRYDVGGLILEYKLGISCDEIEEDDGYYYGYFEYDAKDIEIEVSSGPMSEVADELGITINNSVDFAKGFAAYMAEYGEAVEYGTEYGRQGEVGYIIYEEEESVVGFYTDGSTGWMVMVVGDVATYRAEMIELATDGYLE